jgi:prevent-host-death family protein
MSATLTANMLDAKTRLSHLVGLVESGEVEEIVIARNGRPAARLVPVRPRAGVRLGVAKGEFSVPDSIDSGNEEIAQLLAGEGDASAP